MRLHFTFLEQDSVTKMAFNLRVEPATEDDMPRCMEIFNHAFEFVPIHEISHGTDTLANRVQSGKRHFRGQTEHMAKFSSAPVCIKCIQTDRVSKAEKIVGYAEWYIYDRERTALECEDEGYMLTFSWMESTEERERCLAFVKPGNDARRRLMGTQPFGQLKYMCVDPAHRRQGIGSAVVRWGMEQCDTLKIPAYLEASSEGLAMYQKLGFKEMPGTEGDGGMFPAMIWWPATEVAK